jgi:hypothetical protein
VDDSAAQAGGPRAAAEEPDAGLFLAQLRSWNTTELAAGLRHSGFKHFLRVHVEADSLTFYTLGIRRVRRRWVEWTTARERPFPTAKGDVGNLQVIDHFVVTRPPARH